MSDLFKKIGLTIPDILLPAQGVDLNKWSVIACDQYTSHMEYWEKTISFVGDNPSTLKITLPEIFLEAHDEEEKISVIHESMQTYIQNSILQNYGKGVVLLERKTASGDTRKGIICALDLELYDYNKNSESLIRPTEGTIVERIPPRIKIREKAVIETPHIMVLIDDPEKKVIEPLFQSIKKEKLYNFELMNNGGHSKGYFLQDKEEIEEMGRNLLAVKESFHEKYSVKKDTPPLLFAMGDGNHSFATAKAWWERVKEENPNDPDIMSHPARWALVEIVNIHDESIKFEPIHRVLFNVDPEKILEEFKSFWEKQGSIVTIMEDEEIKIKFNESDNVHRISFCCEKSQGTIEINNPKKNIEAGDIQDAINHICEKAPDIKVDYIHGADHVIDLGRKKNNIGFILPAIEKNSFFKSIILDGALPRKSFSMGEADDKRFYMECRKIVR